VTQTSFVAVEGGSAECAVLAQAVRSGPLRRRLPFPYHPHVTLAVELSDEAHDQAEAELRDFSFDFTVRVIERYELTDHGVWESVAAFELKGPPSAP